MKACPKCNTQNNDTARFCIQCREYLKPEPRKCPNGHVMDSTWTECNICKNQAQPVSVGVRRETVAEGNTPPPRPPSPGPCASAPQQPASNAAKGRRVTRYAAPGMDASSPSGGSQSSGEPSSPRSAGRRIVGILITYTWKPEGQLFAVREGRNLIGRDPEQCEIAVPEDNTLSSTNTHITFRKTFVIGDMVSMSGTDVDGEPIEQQFRPLHNYATIRTGSTYWTFISAQPDDEEA